MKSSIWIPVIGLSAVALGACGTKTETVTLDPAELEFSTQMMEFGQIDKGARIDKTVTVSNSGDVPLGIKTVELASDLDARYGHSGSFRLIWSCGDVQAPNLEDTDDQTAKRGDLGLDDSGDTGDTFDTGDTGDGGTDADCVIPAGGHLPVKVRFQPTRAGENFDAIIVTTFGEDLDTDESRAKAVDERVYRDLDTTWRMLYLNGQGNETKPRALIQPKTANFGFVYEGQTESRFVTIRNAGDGELEVGDISINQRECSEGFSLGYYPERRSLISGDEAKIMEVIFTAPDDRRAQCRIEVETSDPQDPDAEPEITDVLLRANYGSNPANVAPSVVIHSPPPGYQHQGLDPLPLELTVFDANEPSKGLYCKVRSALQGIKDGRPALADCSPKEGNESGHMILPIPVDFYVKPGLEVLLVRVTDAMGVTREASVPVQLNSAYDETDDDGDGFGITGEWIDCDDTNPTIHPLAAEVHDGRDNDCDRLVDEGTDGFDDDGDGMSEGQGDCDDANPDTYKGGPELRDQADNDCDGIVDENTTAFDDDGDGYTELENDCNDSDPGISPGAEEICADGIDNDCDRILDKSDPEGCISLDSTPMLVGGLNLSRTAVELGDTLQASVLVFEEDEDELSYEWQVGKGQGIIDDPSAPGINWQAPADLSDTNVIGDVYRVYCIAEDPQGNQAWGFEQIWVYPQGDLNISLLKDVEVQRTGCNSVGYAPIGMLGGFGLLLLGLRRRRQD